MSIIKRHKNLAIVGILTIVLVIILFILCSKMIFPTGNGIYGQRLDGLVKIDKALTNEIIEEVKDKKEVEDITIRTQGKIIYTTIIYKKGTKVDTAKSIAEKTIEKYSEEIISYYDFEYFVKENIESTEDEKNTGFVLAGTKHPDTKGISWTK